MPKSTPTPDRHRHLAHDRSRRGIDDIGVARRFLGLSGGNQLEKLHLFPPSDDGAE
jgi:hypothetical protein